MSKSYLPPLKATQYFLVAAQLSSFKLAAQELNVTQAAISQQIRLLESYFGFPLFIRKTRQVLLTEKGRILQPFIEGGFAQIHAGVRQLAGDPKPTILRISTIHSFTSIWLLPRLSTFQSENPDLMVQIAPSNHLVDFDKGEIDLAIRVGTGDYKGLVAKKIVQDEIVLIASPLLIREEQTLNPQVVFSLPWIEDISSDICEVFEFICGQYNIAMSDIVPLVKTDNSVTIIENVVAGRGIALVQRSLVSDHIKSCKLLTLLNFSHKSPFSLYLVAPEQNFNWEKVKQFEKWLISSIEDSYGIENRVSSK